MWERGVEEVVMESTAQYWKPVWLDLGVLRIHQHHPDSMLFQNVVQRDPIHSRCLHATVSIRHDFNHSAIWFRAAVQQPNSRTGLVSRSGGTATKWLSFPTSIPPASACTIAKPASLAATRRPNSLRCERFIWSTRNRSKVDILRFAMPYSSRLLSDSGSARLAKETTDSPAGSGRTFFKAGSPPINASQQPKSR
jgi:hypothetical protein